MDIVIDFPAARSLDGVKFDDLTAVPYLGYEVVDHLEYPEPGTISAGVTVLHFDGDLTGPERAAVIMRCRTTPTEETIRDRAKAAVGNNAQFLALAQPNQSQLAAQVRALTKECNALLRLALGLVDSDADT